MAGGGANKFRLASFVCIEIEFRSEAARERLAAR